jgi:hypothetical protein
MAQAAVLNWINPTQDVNGNPLPASAITSIVVFNNGVQFDTVLPTGGVPPTTYTSSALSPGTYVFTVAAVDSAGSSAQSNSVSAVVVPPSVGIPLPPTNLTVTLSNVPPPPL